MFPFLSSSLANPLTSTSLTLKVWSLVSLSHAQARLSVLRSGSYPPSLLQESRKKAEKTRDSLRTRLHQEEESAYETKREREKRLSEYRYGRLREGEREGDVVVPNENREEEESH